MFFLVTTHFSKAEQEQQYPIELPKVTAAQPLTGLPDEIVVNVARDGSIYLGKQQRTPDALELELKAAVARYKDQEVMIRGDADGAFQHVMTVMNEPAAGQSPPGRRKPLIVCRLDLDAEKMEMARLAAAIFQPALLVVLAAGLVLASAHLLTMLGTRWGRRRVSQKALLFSIVVHLSLISGILALWPEALPAGAQGLRWGRRPPPPPPPEAFRVFTESDLEVPETRPDAPATSAQPIWNQVADTFEETQARTVPESLPIEEPPPDVRPEATIPEPPELAVTTPLPEPEVMQPDLADVPAESPPAVELPATVNIPVATETGNGPAEAEAAPPIVPRERLDRTPDSIANLSDPGSVQRPEAAPIERIVPEPQLDAAPLSVAGDFDEQARLPNVDEGLSRWCAPKGRCRRRFQRPAPIRHRRRTTTLRCARRFRARGSRLRTASAIPRTWRRRCNASAPLSPTWPLRAGSRPSVEAIRSPAVRVRISSVHNSACRRRRAARRSRPRIVCAAQKNVPRPRAASAATHNRSGRSN
jgi:biopolymer transport protein ExbD